MKRISILIIVIFVCLGISSQTSNDVIIKMQEIRQESGDSIARDYLVSNQSVFINENANPTYLVLWGVLTSNMWNSNPSEALRIEYKMYLDSIIADEVKSDSYTPDQESLPTVWQLTHDYYLMLYRDGDRENALNLLKCIHRWFKLYPDMRNTVGYAQSLLDLNLLLVRDMHRYEEGQPYAEEYIDVSKSVYGETSAQYAVAIYNMHVFPSKPISEKAEIIKNAISIYEKADYQDPAMLELMKSTYKAQMVALTGVTNTENIRVADKEKISLADCMALVAADRGVEAIGSLLYHKKVLEDTQYLDTLQYANVISLVIGAYINANDLSSAQKEIDDFNSKIGIDNVPPNYSQIFYSSAGLIAMRLKDYARALRYTHAACRISELSSVMPLETCKVLCNLSIMYAEAANYVDKQFILDAKWYADEAISLFEEKIGLLLEHGAVGLALLNNKASVYDAIGDNKGAIETYENIVANFADNKDVQSAWVLAANNLAVSYMKTGNANEAIALLEPLITKNKELQKQFIQNLALSYYVTNDSKLKTTLINHNNICYDNCLDVFNFFTEAERENFWTLNARELLVLNNMVADKYPDMANIAFDNLLFVKNLKLMSSDILKDIVDSSSNAELRRKYKKYLSLREAISYQSTMRDSIMTWKNQLKEEERSILALIPNFKERLLSSFHSWDEIKKALKEDEIAIDFTYVPKMEDWDKYQGFYGAFVITNDSKIPHLVSLCEVDSINQYFANTNADAMQISKLYQESVPIYNKLWGKLEPYLKGKKTIYFSPAGQLNLLNHNALVMPNGELFGNTYNLVRLSSTDKILLEVAKSKVGKNYQSAVIYGGILYDLSVADMQEAAKLYSHYNDEYQSLLAMRSEDERGHWNYLPGTKAESQNIYNLLTSGHISTKLLQEKQANEESFKALSGHSPEILHLSTHGFFLDTKEKVNKNPFMHNVGNYSEKEDQLIRTGVLMAGANNVWCGRDQVTGIEDGILTADEISRLDLSGTKLVVLSACETAKGRVDEIDGVLGLQRGLKKAGVESVLMTLWKVSDTVTSILMTHFYENIGTGMNSRQSLKNAVQKVREQYPDPYFWASFIILD